MESKFIHKVSKGTKFNQIYIPKEAQNYFEAGDIVEVKLIKKKNNLYCNNVKIFGFKKKLILDVFNFFNKYKEIKQVIFFGSFLTEINTYRDIDLFIIVKKEKESLYKKISDGIGREFNLKFHLLISEEEKKIHSLQSSPLIRSMFYRSVSNKKIEIPKKRIINKNHLLYLLMMPQDLVSLNYNFESRTYYDSLRRVIIIEDFLKNEDEDALKAKKTIEELIGKDLLEKCLNNEIINNRDIKLIKDKIKNKLKFIESRLKNE